MGVVKITYRADKPGKKTPYYQSKGMLPFGAFCVSPRVQGLVLKIGRDTATLAKMFVPPSDDERNGHYRDKFVVTPGKLLKIEGLERATSLVGNTSPSAAAVEFGSGEPSVGDSSGESRPQGGYNVAKRPLGKAGRMMGDFHE